MSDEWWMMSVSYSSRRERSLSNPRRKSGDPPQPPPSSQRPRGTRSQSACPLGHGLRPTWSKPQTQVWGPTGPLLPPLSVPEGRALWRQHKQHKQQAQCNMHWARAPHVAGRKLSALSMLSLEKKIHTQLTSSQSFQPSFNVRLTFV